MHVKKVRKNLKVGNVMVSLIIVIVYLALLFGVCGWAQVKQKKQEASGGKVSFLMAGKNLPMLLVVMLMMGNMIGSTNTTGLAQLAMGGGGMTSVMYGLAGVGGVLFLGIVGARRMRKLNYSTTAEMMADYNGSASRYLMVVGQIIIVGGVACLQYVAGGAMLASMFPGVISVNTGIAITAVAFIIVCLLGGLFGASLANLINVIVIYVALIACLIAAISGMGGWESFVASANAIPEATTNGGSWLSLTGGLSVATCLSYFVSEPGNRISTQSNTQCALAAKDAKTARWGIIIAALGTIPVCFISAVIGIIARIQFPEAATAQAMSLVITSLNPALSGLGLAGLWAVNVSSGVALLMACVQLLCYDVITPLRRDKKPVAKKQSQLVLLILGVVTLLCAYIATDIVKTLTILLCITPAFFLGMIAMMYFPKLLKKHTMVITQVVAYIFFAAWLFIPAVKAAFPTPIYVEWPLCVAVFFLCYFFDKTPITPPAPHKELD